MADDGAPAAARPKVSDAVGVGPDLIGGLPDDLLLTILLRVPTIEAIRTCLLSRRWRTLWTRLPELRFDDEDAGGIWGPRFTDLVDGALRRSGPGNISALEVIVANPANIEGARVAAWPGVAAQRVTGRFDFALQPGNRVDCKNLSLELPCFPRAKKIFLTVAAKIRLPGPDAGTFACLTQLELSDVHFSGNGVALGDVVSSCCPRLEVLCIAGVYNLRELTLRTESLLELRIDFVPDLMRLEVVASNLLQMHLFSCLCVNKGHRALLVHAPFLEVVGLQRCNPQEMRFVDKRHLQKLAFRGFVSELLKGNSTRILRNFSHIDHLKLHICMPLKLIEDPRLTVPIELPHHFELELVLLRDIHTFGSNRIPLLRSCKDTEKLTCTLISSDTKRYGHCAPECVCRHQPSWSDANMACFDSLRELVLTGFMGMPDETGFLQFIFGSAGALKSVSITFSEYAKPSADTYQEIVSFLPAGCSIAFT